MDKVEPGRLDQLQAGDDIRLADITELAAFEDLIAQSVDPNFDRELWATRPALQDLIRPPKFNGTIADITLEEMDHPYQRLLDARQRGWHFQRGGGSFELSSRFASELIPKYRGFILAASGRSSGRGTIGSIQTEIWYYPLPLEIERRASGKDRIRKNPVYRGQAIRRVVAVPKIDQVPWRDLDQTARAIGFRVSQQAMLHPIVEAIERKR
ncbi:hypothetical protein HY441_01715 [Candidatus Microgenomates bacterium]|nr:hypothetical protein [Candidatus Microgenomates bacterium]